MKTIKIPSHKVVSREEWLKARKTHLAKENSSPGNAMSLAGSAASYPGSRSKSPMGSTVRRARRRSPTSSMGAAN